jgi:hypothetical protein
MRKLGAIRLKLRVICSTEFGCSQKTRRDPAPYFVHMMTRKPSHASARNICSGPTVIRQDAHHLYGVISHRSVSLIIRTGGAYRFFRHDRHFKGSLQFPNRRVARPCVWRLRASLRLGDRSDLNRANISARGSMTSKGHRQAARRVLV